MNSYKWLECHILCQWGNNLVIFSSCKAQPNELLLKPQNLHQQVTKKRGIVTEGKACIKFWKSQKVEAKQGWAPCNDEKEINEKHLFMINTLNLYSRLASLMDHCTTTMSANTWFCGQEHCWRSIFCFHLYGMTVNHFSDERKFHSICQKMYLRFITRISLKHFP